MPPMRVFSAFQYAHKGGCAPKALSLEERGGHAQIFRSGHFAGLQACDLYLFGAKYQNSRREIAVSEATNCLLWAIR
jgi:hypothetical protein